VPLTFDAGQTRVKKIEVIQNRARKQQRPSLAEGLAGTTDRMRGRGNRTSAYGHQPLRKDINRRGLNAVL